ncbi:tyrosine-type recombinase/integrase [Rossellomorea aquimaris]|uniref:tyrosine-type recombinase/integrase n=1 Tax=Rossellomorea aquimaris TaxID=189382 RepID=UPI001CD67F84|nr:tyrosine-type recombinase/integrase [Rossellomorea aquimaris]MCA1059779.1 tyrosine-type recombinase/integrase [Rossellomorea aquimaris]
MSRKRRSNNLSVNDLTKLRGSLRSDYIDFEDGVDLFIKDAKIRNLREHTIKYYENELRAFKRLLEGQDVDTTPGNITPEIIRENVILYLRDVKGLKITSVNTRLRAIRAYFNFLYERNYLPTNPMRDVKQVRDRKSVIATFSVKQLNDLLNQPDLKTFTGVRDYTLMLLLVETGIRANELVGLKITDIHWDESNLLIRNTKGYKQRMVPLSVTMKDQLRRYSAIRGVIVDCDSLFVTVDETPLTKRQIQNRISQYGKDAKISNVRCSPHTFRHTFAKLSVKNGAGIFELQTILGHTTMDMVKTYVNLFSDDVKDKHRKFSPLNNLKQRRDFN